MNKYKKSIAKGFTIVELLIVVIVLVVLSALVYTSIANFRERTYFTNAQSDLMSIANAIKLYQNNYNTTPADVSFGIPSEITEFLDKDIVLNGTMLTQGPWPHSHYDYEYWDVYDAANNTYGSDGIKETLGISIHFCRDPITGASTDCQFPKQPWAAGFTADSGVIYCIKGYCKASLAASYSLPTYCINCPDNKPIAPPGAP